MSATLSAEEVAAFTMATLCEWLEGRRYVETEQIVRHDVRLIEDRTYASPVQVWAFRAEVPDEPPQCFRLTLNVEEMPA